MPTQCECADERTMTANDLAAAIHRRFRSLIGELRIEVVEGGVVLHGLAYSFYGKQIALHEVRQHGAFVVLANRITVVGRTTDCI